MSGEIIKNYKISCGECYIQDDLFCNTIKECEKKAIENGYIKVYKLGWICPECQLKRIEEE